MATKDEMIQALVDRAASTIGDNGKTAEEIASLAESYKLFGGSAKAVDIAFAPDGDIAATTVQAAVVEVRDDGDVKFSAVNANSVKTSMFLGG